MLPSCTVDEEAAPPSRPAEVASSGALDSAGLSDASTALLTGEAVGAARVDFESPGDGAVTGGARLDAYDEGVRVEVRVTGLAPGLHGLHIHDATDCTDVGASPHFDPDRHPHGDPEDPRPLHHAGDLGNLRASDDGARLDRVFPDLRLAGRETVVGRTLVIHAEQDDLNTQPDGESGAAVACGVIRSVDTP